METAARTEADLASATQLIRADTSRLIISYTYTHQSYTHTDTHTPCFPQGESLILCPQCLRSYLSKPQQAPAQLTLCQRPDPGWEKHSTPAGQSYPGCLRGNNLLFSGLQDRGESLSCATRRTTALWLKLADLEGAPRWGEALWPLLGGERGIMAAVTTTATQTPEAVPTPSQALKALYPTALLQQPVRKLLFSLRYK